MRMRGGLALSLLLLTGCAGQAPMGGTSPEARAASEDKPGARIHTELGAGYFARGQHAVALQELRKALEADPGYAPAFNILGLVHADLREDRQAEDSFRRALERSPNYSEAHNNYGLFLCQRGLTTEALARFENALGNPLYATPEKALANAGICALEKGDAAQAEVYFFRALKRAPNLLSAQLGMAEVHYRHGRWLAARTLLRQASQGGELSAQALWLGVRTERRMGDREAESSYGAQLRRRFPDTLQTQWLITSQYDQAGSWL